MATTTASESGPQLSVDDLLISADSHVAEPYDLWTTRLPKGLRDQAPTFPSAESAQSKPGGLDPNERVKEMAVDGVSLEVLYATKGMTLFRIEDVALQKACVRVFNDWLIEFCAVSPNRLFGIALTSLQRGPRRGRA
jgi:predicted TIM-barrel fold metal-dependent hydrolase